MNRTEIKNELEKCKSSPWYFATKYLVVNGEPFTTRYSEKEFNDQIKKLKQS